MFSTACPYINILLADDHPIIRAGLCLIIEGQPDLKVIGEVGDGYEAVALATQAEVDLVIMDISMPRLNGIEATRQIRAACPTTEVVILSMHTSSRYIFQALNAGAKGYVLKSSHSKEVVEAIRAVVMGRPYLSQEFPAEILNQFQQGEFEKFEDPLKCLSPREREVFQLVIEGKSSAKIGVQLQLSTKTVESYRSRLMTKLNLKDLPSLVKFAISHDLTSGSCPWAY